MSEKNNEYVIGEKEVKPNDAMDMGFPVVEKPKNFRKSIGSLIKYSKSYFPFVIIALIFAAGGTVFALFGPGKMSDMVDIVQRDMFTGIDLPAVASIGILLIILYSLSMILSFIQGYIMATVTQKLTKQMRTDISRKINRLPIEYYNKHTTGDILSRITNDADTVGQNINQSIGTLVSSVVMLTGAIIMMFITNWIMTLTAIGATIIGFILMMLIMGKSQKYFGGQQKYLGKINGHIEEAYAGHTIVKAYNAEKEMRDKFQSVNKNLKDSAFKAQVLSGLMMPIMIFIDNFGYVAVCVVGAVLALNGTISFGVIVAFMLYVRYFSQPLTQIAQSMQGLQMAAAASERVFEFLGEEEMPDESHKAEILSAITGKVGFQNVKFGYENDKMIIHDFTAMALPGQKIAIVGPTGAGKTTLVNLLMRFYELNGGDITIDGVPISQMTREQIHSLFCMILQDTWLFEGTIKENIIYCKKDVCDEDVKKVCKAVGLHHFVSTLSNGYETVLDDKANLSAGQKQQITIARAMLQNAPMLILDEATSSVDTRTELHIQEAMDKLMEGRTSFVIAHRLSTIKNADLILVLKDGDIVESGNHNELLKQKGFYAELYNSQFEAA